MLQIKKYTHLYFQINYKYIFLKIHEPMFVKYGDESLRERLFDQICRC